MTNLTTRSEILKAAYESVRHDLLVASKCRNKYACQRERARARRWWKIQDRLRAKLPRQRVESEWVTMIRTLLNMGDTRW